MIPYAERWEITHKENLEIAERVYKELATNISKEIARRHVRRIAESTTNIRKAYERGTDLLSIRGIGDELIVNITKALNEN